MEQLSEFENCSFYKVLYGRQNECMQNLIKIEISKMIALCDTLVDESENCFKIVLKSFMFVFDQTLVEHLYCDKGLLG